jgi:hypothetical protein
LGVAYQLASTMAHKLRHRLSEYPARPLRGFRAAHEISIGDRGGPYSRGRSTKSPVPSLVVAAVEKVHPPKNKKGHAVKHPHCGCAGDARIAGCRPPARPNSVPSRKPMRPPAHLPTDGFAGHRSEQADLGAPLKHTPIILDQGANATEFVPIIHALFSNVKAGLAGTHHGVSAKHLPCYR